MGVSYIGDRSLTQVGPQRVIRRTKEGATTILDPRLSQKIFNHSPDGFQWGYSGSGPAQLALAILLDVTGDSRLSATLHQEFKRDKIAGLGDRFILTEEEIWEWVNNKKLRE